MTVVTVTFETDISDASTLFIQYFKLGLTRVELNIYNSNWEWHGKLTNESRTQQIILNIPGIIFWHFLLKVISHPAKYAHNVFSANLMEWYAVAFSIPLTNN